MKVKTKEWNDLAEKKAAWGPGPWQDEPDRKQWEDPDTGLPCLAVRNQTGAWCGYVGVREGHPLFDKEYSSPAGLSLPKDAVVGKRNPITILSLAMSDTKDGDRSPEDVIDVHGSLTYSDRCSGRICHEAEGDVVWWFGFDCAHSGDYYPGIHGTMIAAQTLMLEGGEQSGTYRDLPYVEAECKRLAEQLAEVKRRVMVGG